MGSPVDSGGGLHTKPAAQAGYMPGLLYARRAGNCRLPEICQTDLYAVSRCGPPAVATPRRRSGGTGRQDELIVVGAQPVTYAHWSQSRCDLAVARHIQRLVGDHRHLVGPAGPWSPRGTLAGIRPRPVGQAGP
jgi:hypothetical protein